MRYSLLPLLLALTGAPALSAQMAEEIKGRVLPARGEETLPDSVMVTLRSQRGSFVETHPVHLTGNFAFVNVPPGGGQYTLEIRSPNRLTVTRKFTLLPGTTGYSGIAPFMAIQLGSLIAAGEVAASDEKTLSAKWLQLPEEVREVLEAADAASGEGRHEEAVAHLLRAVEMQPDLYHAYNNLAVEYLALGKREAAVEALQSSIGIEPGLVSTHRNLGAIFLESGELEKALEALLEARKLDPADFETQMLLGETYYLHEELSQARDAFAAAIAVRPDDAEAHLNLGQCLLRLGRTREAVAEFRLFLEKDGGADPRNVEVRRLVARLESSSG